MPYNGPFSHHRLVMVGLAVTTCLSQINVFVLNHSNLAASPSVSSPSSLIATRLDSFQLPANASHAGEAAATARLPLHQTTGDNGEEDEDEDEDKKRGHDEQHDEQHSKRAQQQQKEAIPPTFNEEHDFSKGPRSQPYAAGSSFQQIVEKYGHASMVNITLMTTRQASNQTQPPSSLPSGWCNVKRGESYAAAWITSTPSLLKNNRVTLSELYNPKAPLNLERGYYAAIRNVNTPIYRSVDMFDFYVHHLSSYEKTESKFNGRIQYPTLSATIQRRTTEMMEGYRQRGHNNPTGIRNGHVLAILPFYATTDNNDDHHILGTSIEQRRAFFRLTLLTVANVFPNVVVYVATKSDYDYALQHSEYIYDIQWIRDLRDPQHLPYAASVHTKRLLRKGTYDRDQFDFVYYSETDQMPHLRDVDAVLAGALEMGTVVVPHRGKPYATYDDLERPARSLSWLQKEGATAVALEVERDCNEAENGERGGLDKDLLIAERSKQVEERYRHHLDVTSSLHVVNVPDIMAASCCFPATCPTRKEVSLEPIDPESTEGSQTSSSSKVVLFRQHESFAHVAGTGNERIDAYQVCRLNVHKRERCS